MDVTIAPLWGHRELAPLLARWHHDEFGYLYDARVWNHEIATLELEAMSEPGSRDVTWIAYDGATADTRSLLGSVSLIGSDDLPGFERLSPWLASLYVTPRARSTGLGGRLVERVVAEAAARGHGYVHLFTAGQDAYYAARGWRSIAEVDHRGHRAVVMAKATSARGARRAVSSQWCADPDSRGAYSYLRIGATPDHRARLAREILLGLWFAGEATSVEYPATMHGAWFSGERAADAAVAAGAGDVLVIGAGLAGIAAARRVTSTGRTACVVEARLRPGGRVATDNSLGIPLPLGAAWLHGDIGHPLAGLVSSRPDDEWGAGFEFVTGHGLIGDAAHAQAELVHRRVEARMTEAGPRVSATDALRDALDAEPGLDPLIRDVVAAAVTVEIESLYGAPMHDFAPGVGFEPYELPGDDCVVTSSIEPAVAALADGLSIAYGERVHRLSARHGEWTTDTGRRASAVIVTVPVAVLDAGAIEFAPALPDDVRESCRMLGTGPITKLFTTYDTRWWPTERRPIRIVGAEVWQAVDMTALTEVPTLCWFATGEAARAIEAMTEHEQCVMIDRVSRDCGLTDWDA